MRQQSSVRSKALQRIVGLVRIRRTFQLHPGPTTYTCNDEPVEALFALLIRGEEGDERV